MRVKQEGKRLHELRISERRGEISERNKVLYGEILEVRIDIWSVLDSIGIDPNPETLGITE